MTAPGAAGGQVASSAGHGLRAEHPCPQCGGGVVIDETDRLLACPYCRVRLYMVPESGAYHFYLPPKAAAPGDLVFAPYWRIRGPAFTCGLDAIEHRVIDATIRAVDLTPLPTTLGVRPQAMKLKFALPETKGTFLAPSVEFPATVRAIASACGHADEEAEGTEILHEGFLAATASVVYLPLRIREDGAVFDTVREERIGTLASPANGPGGMGAVDPAPALGIRFLPTLCPECGWDMAAARDSLVLLCANCSSAWEAHGGELRRTDCSVMRVEWQPQIHLPFWRIRARATGMTLASYGDVARLANLPVVVESAWNKEDLWMWTPAFKVHSEHFLRLAKTMTIRRPGKGETIDSGVPKGDCHPVNVPAASGAESLKLIVADLANPKRAFFPRLPGIAIAGIESQLVYVPFQAAGSEWTHPGQPISIMRTLLEFGRNL